MIKVWAIGLHTVVINSTGDKNMKNKNDIRKEEGSLFPKAAVTCPDIMEGLGVGVICCLPDEDLTFLWGNGCYYSSIGYKQEEYTESFGSLREYFAGYEEDFANIKKELERLRETGGKGSELSVRMPGKDGSFGRFRFSGSLVTAEEEEGPLLQAVFTDISRLSEEKEEQFSAYKQNQQYFHWMMDTYVGNVYISDMDTYELLYLNQHSCDTLGYPLASLIGKKCYEAIQGRTSPCPFCTNDRLREDEFYEWKFYNPALERTFMIKDRIINWEGRRARIELSHDMFSTEYKLAQKDQERDALLSSIPGGIFRLDGRDMSTVLWYGCNFLDMIEYTGEQFQKELGSRYDFIHPDDKNKLDGILQEVKKLSLIHI